MVLNARAFFIPIDRRTVTESGQLRQLVVSSIPHSRDANYEWLLRQAPYTSISTGAPSSSQPRRCGFEHWEVLFGTLIISHQLEKQGKDSYSFILTLYLWTTGVGAKEEASNLGFSDQFSPDLSSSGEILVPVGVNLPKPCVLRSVSIRKQHTPPCYIDLVLLNNWLFSFGFYLTVKPLIIWCSFCSCLYDLNSS